MFTLRLAQSLQARGHEPILQWFDHRYEVAPWLLRCVPLPKGVDVIHAGTSLGCAFTHRRAPLIVTEHQYIRHPAFLPYRTIKQAMYHRVVLWPAARTAIKGADAITAVSRHTADAMSQDMNITPSIVYNWVDTTSFVPRPGFIRNEREPLKLLYVGNPSIAKGVDVILPLASQLGSTVEIHCLGGLRRRFPVELADAGNIRIVARTEPSAMPELYRKFDAILIPTRYEAFGFVALEAMACGLPVVGFSGTGMSEVCVDGETALLGPIDDLTRLAANVSSLCDPDLRKMLGEAGRARAISQFSESSSIEAYVQIYRAICAKLAH